MASESAVPEDVAVTEEVVYACRAAKKACVGSPTRLFPQRVLKQYH